MIDYDHFSPLAKIKPQAGVMVGIEALHALASFVDKDWGDYGYRLSIVARIAPSTLSDQPSELIVAEVGHHDGSRFHIAADRFGNARYLGRL